ncbi:uncharacterized protein LOC119685160 [Teleopsis dalmanni]|uniref:uncharacterized protein LOC119685160 n=1 Tax=Teleopsis dalmanni TaxID=139649 RepID=UPI0018CF9671|nr:uncharacterized protein LOC119685160 [Teleopsis dalmanni]XP_037955302.1 uncharacterized protein LOC119685160 [Teleopsis dalmanni]
MEYERNMDTGKLLLLVKFRLEELLAEGKLTPVNSDDSDSAAQSFVMIKNQKRMLKKIYENETKEAAKISELNKAHIIEKDVSVVNEISAEEVPEEPFVFVEPNYCPGQYSDVEEMIVNEEENDAIILDEVPFEMIDAEEFANIVNIR